MTKLLAWSAAMLLMVGAHPAVAVGNADQGRPATIPIRAFAALPQLRRPLLSPNGRQIVALNEMDGITSLALINCDQPDAAPHFIRIGKTTITDLRWAGSRRLLLTIRASQKIGSEEIPFLRLLALDVPSGASRVVDTKSRGIYAGDVLYSDPTGSWASVASQDDVYSYPSVKRSTSRQVRRGSSKRRAITSGTGTPTIRAWSVPGSRTRAGGGRSGTAIKPTKSSPHCAASSPRPTTVPSIGSSSAGTRTAG
jgi:hypothetical protein